MTALPLKARDGEVHPLKAIPAFFKGYVFKDKCIYTVNGSVFVPMFVPAGADCVFGHVHQ